MEAGRTRPAPSPPPPHYHPSQDEHFEVLEGAIALKIGHERSVVPAGESFDIPRGDAHTHGPVRTARHGSAGRSVRRSARSSSSWSAL